LRELGRREAKMGKKRTKKKIVVHTRGAGKFPSFRVHTAGPKSSGKPVGPYFASKQDALDYAKKKAQKTGRTYMVFRPVAKIEVKK